MNKESKLNLNAGDYTISHCDSDKTYNGLEVHKMLCDAYIAGSNETFDDEAYRKAYYDGYNKCDRDWIHSQEDERIRHYLMNFVKINDGVNLPPDYAKKALAWLEKQKGNNGGISPTWSEEDEKTLNEIFSVAARASLRKSTLFGKSYDYIKWQNWLKSLRPQNHKSLRPQNHWKPSEHELEVLRLVAEKDGTCLMGLYEQLKKLKEGKV